jgi:hypothetical protein
MVWRLLLPYWNQPVVTEMSQPISKGNNSYLTKLKLQLQLAKPSMNTGLNIPTLGDTPHTATPVGCSVSSDVTPQHAARSVSSSTVVTAEGHVTLFIFPAKNIRKIQLPIYRVSQAIKLHFSKFWVLCPFWGAHCTPQTQFCGLGHLPNTYTYSYVSTFLLPSSR